MKKSLAILLSLALILCMIPSTAFATTSENTDGGEAREQLSISNAKISLPAGPFIYNLGEGIQPVPTVTDADGKTIDSSNYDVSYENNTGVGEATIKVSGKNAYTGETIAKFNIVPLNLGSAGVTITEKQGSEITSETVTVANIVVKYNNKVIDKGFDVTSKPSPADKEVVLVTIKAADNNFTGEKTQAFNIRKNISTGYTVEAPAYTYTGKAIEPSLTFKKDGKIVSLVKGTDYTVSYSDNVNAGTCTITVGGQGKYIGTFSGHFEIKPKSVSGLSIEIPNVTQGSTILPIVKDGNILLKEGTDYTFTTPNTSTAGSYSIDITGIGNYTGSKKANYNVISTNNTFGTANVTFGTETPFYNGGKQYKSLTVKVGNTVLTNGRDYKVEYSKDGKTTSYADNAGTYIVTVTGIGSYSGNVTGTFTITPVPLDFAEIVLGSSTVAYGGVYVPKVSVRHKYLNFYFPETDYDVTYRNINYSSRYLKPTAVITPKANGNLTTNGSVKKELTAEFSLASRSIYNCNINFTDYRNSKNYDGKANFKPTVVVKDYNNNVTLRENYDYKVTYKDAKGKVVYSLVDAGVYSVIVEGTGAYSGTQTLTYTIYGTDISGYTVTLRESSVNYDGRSHMPSIVSVKKGYYSSLSSNDYTVTYEGPDGKEVSAYNIKNSGTYKVIVTGKNGYSGSIYAEYRIVGKPQNVTVTGKPSGKIYATSDTFKLTGYATGAGSKVTYSSSNPSVASVSSLGYVTPKKVGKTVITVSTYGDTSYEPATKEVTIVISPKKAVLTQKPWTSGQKKLFKVRWNYQEGANRYQIMYSQDKSFKKGTYKLKSVNAHNLNAATQSTAVKGLKSGKRYYVKVRAIYQDKDYRGRVIKNYWGTWSNWRSVVVK